MLNFNLDDEMAKIAAAENAVVDAANKQNVSVAQLDEDEKINNLLRLNRIAFYSKPKREVKGFFDNITRFFFHLESIDDAGTCKNCGMEYPYEKVGRGHGGFPGSYVGGVYRCKNCGCLRSDVHYESCF